MNFIEFLGNILSKELEISTYAARGLIKLSIKDEFGPFFPLDKITYKLIRKVIKNSLFFRMKRLEVFRFEEIRNYLLDELVKNQSLITFESI